MSDHRARDLLVRAGLLILIAHAPGGTAPDDELVALLRNRPGEKVEYRGVFDRYESDWNAAGNSGGRAIGRGGLRQRLRFVYRQDGRAFESSYDVGSEKTSFVFDGRAYLGWTVTASGCSGRRVRIPARIAGLSPENGWLASVPPIVSLRRASDLIGVPERFADVAVDLMSRTRCVRVARADGGREFVLRDPSRPGPAGEKARFLFQGRGASTRPVAWTLTLVEGLVQRLAFTYASDGVSPQKIVTRQLIVSPGARSIEMVRATYTVSSGPAPPVKRWSSPPRGCSIGEIDDDNLTDQLTPQPLAANVPRPKPNTFELMLAAIVAVAGLAVVGYGAYLLRKRRA